MAKKYKPYSNMIGGFPDPVDFLASLNLVTQAKPGDPGSFEAYLRVMRAADASQLSAVIANLEARCHAFTCNTSNTMSLVALTLAFISLFLVIQPNLPDALIHLFQLLNIFLLIACGLLIRLTMATNRRINDAVYRYTLCQKAAEQVQRERSQAHKVRPRRKRCKKKHPIKSAAQVSPLERDGAYGGTAGSLTK